MYAPSHMGSVRLGVKFDPPPSLPLPLLFLLPFFILLLFDCYSHNLWHPSHPGYLSNFLPCLFCQHPASYSQSHLHYPQDSHSLPPDPLAQPESLLISEDKLGSVYRFFFLSLFNFCNMDRSVGYVEN
jgi:hypothetical protein